MSFQLTHTNWEKLQKQYEVFDNCMPLQFDTQKLFANGACQFESVKVVEDMMDQIEAITGKLPSKIFLYDSRAYFGSEIYLRAVPRQGFIWHRLDYSLLRLLEYDIEIETNMNSQ